MTPQPPRLILYTREGCHLCERLEELVAPRLRALAQQGRPYELVRRDIEDDENWRNLYGDRIPVLTLGGDVLLEGRPEPADAVRALRDL